MIQPTFPMTKTYESISGLISQAGTDLPIIILLHQSSPDFGIETIERDGVGDYEIFFTKQITQEKFWCNISPNWNGYLGAGYDTADKMYILTKNTAAAPADDRLYYTSFEFRLYS